MASSRTRAVTDGIPPSKGTKGSQREPKRQNGVGVLPCAKIKFKNVAKNQHPKNVHLRTTF
jgi:hypothetical protein